MAAEVSSLMRLLTRHDKDDGGSGGEGNHGGGDLVTRDLLGGSCGGGAAAAPVGDGEEHDLGLGSVTACENRLGVTDLNMPPLCPSGFSPPPPMPAAPHLRSLLQEPRPAAALDLRLRPSAPPPQAEYQSVCTLEKVRSALERAQRESSLRKPSTAAPVPSSPASSSTTTSSAKRRRGAARDEEGERDSKSPSTSTSSSSSVVVQSGEGGSGAAGMAAAGCSSCLLYVLIARADPRCPRCNSAVPLPPPPGKRPRIDLNAAVAPAGAEPAPAAANPLRTVNFF